jgi:hypothetical protein
MATVAAGQEKIISVNDPGQAILTPGVGGSIVILSRDSSDDLPVPRTITTAETISMLAFSTLHFRAVGVDATWVVPPTGGIGRPVLIAKTNQQITRTSSNTAGDTSFASLYSFTLPGGLMGPNGTLFWEAEVSFTDPATGVSANGFQLRVGAVGICPEFSATTGGQTNDNRTLAWHNTSESAQKYRASYIKQSGSAAGFTTTAIDTSVNQTVSFDCRWSAATSAEVLRLESLRVWVEYGS